MTAFKSVYESRGESGRNLGRHLRLAPIFLIGGLFFVQLAMAAGSAAARPAPASQPAGKPTMKAAPDKPLPSFKNSIGSYDEFHAMADQPGGVVRSGEVLKFLIDNRQASAPQIYYINGNYCEGSECPVKWVSLHRTWAERNLKNFHYDVHEFSQITYFTEGMKNRPFIAGRIQTFEKDGKVFMGIWFVEMDRINDEMIQFAVEHVKKSFKAQGYDLSFVQYSTQQSTAKIKPWLDANGIKVENIGALIANVSYLPLNVGEAWGYLRLFPKDPDDLEANEIAVFNELPLDLAIVAGTVTTGFQDVASHVNLKSKERGTPNMVLRDEKKIEELKAQDGQPVHLSVMVDGWQIEPTTPAVIQAKLDVKINRPWKMPGTDLTDGFLQFQDMCAAKDPKVCLALGRRFGGKASRLGFLAHPKVIGPGSAQAKKVGYPLSPLGFGVPLKFYKDFVDYNADQDPAFKRALEELVNAEVGVNGAPPLTSADRRARVADLHERFLNGKFPPGHYERVAAEVVKLKAAYVARYPGEDLNKLKVRSSANVEDIDDFNGAGLHDSYSAKVKKSKPEEADGPCKIVQTNEDSDTKQDVEPESLACAIKGTYASLWNLRAVRERTFRRFDHRGAMMALAVLPSYKARSVPKKLKIKANAVLVTRVLNTSTVYGYQLSSQTDDNLVTNPDPGTLAELATLTFQLQSKPAVTILRYAQPKTDGVALATTVLPEDTMLKIVSIGRTIEEAYCNAKPDYFVVKGQHVDCRAVSNSQRKPKSLDMELKVYDNGEILIKQVREFGGH